MNLITRKRTDPYGQPVIEIFSSHEPDAAKTLENKYACLLGSVDYKHLHLMNVFGYCSDSIHSIIVYAKDYLEFDIPSSFMLVETDT
jgi:hypothetical protein